MGSINSRIFKLFTVITINKADDKQVVFKYIPEALTYFMNELIGKRINRNIEF